MCSGKIIILAFPDTFVKLSDDLICKILPYLGLGTTDYIKAGHAALVLIENKTGKAQYFDFGRYVTPKGMGRVRSDITDFELKINLKISSSTNGQINNLDDILTWLNKNPQKTHGDGRMIASVCDDIDFKKATSFIEKLQNKGSFPYSAFAINGSNCARFVTDTILASTDNQKIIRALKFNKQFTPSCIGTVEIASTAGKVYEIIDGTVKIFKGSALKENLKNYFHKKKRTTVKHSEKSNFLASQSSKNIHLLEGIGSSALFELIDENLSKSYFRIKRYNVDLVADLDAVFKTDSSFISSEEYKFIFDSHCKFCHVFQHGKIIKFEFVALFSTFNSCNKVRLT